jgi:hypothetical protein
MLMHRKIIGLRDDAWQRGELLVEQGYIVPRADSLNKALLKMVEILRRILPLQEQTLEILKEKSEIFQTAQNIVDEGNVEFLLGQIPEETRVYLKETLGLGWAQVGEYLTVENLDKAIWQIEKQQRQIEIISAPENKVDFTNNLGELLQPVPLTAKAAVVPGAAPTQNVLLYPQIQDYISQEKHSGFEINCGELQELSCGVLPAEYEDKAKYFLELTGDIKNVLVLDKTDLLVIHGKKEYLVITSGDDKTLLERKLFAAYLNAYENALINGYLKYDKPGSGKGMPAQEQIDLVIHDLSKTQKGQQEKFNPEYTPKLYKLLRELAILKYNYRDVDNGAHDWQFYQAEACKTLDIIKISVRKKDFQKLENEVNTAVQTWATNNKLETDLPVTESAAPAAENRRGVHIELPHIDLNALQDSLRGLAGDPRAKRVLLVLLALLLLAGGGAGVTQLVKNRRTENSAEPESFFTRAVNTVKEIFRNAGQKLSELFANPKKTPQELRTEGGQIIQEAKDTAENAIQSEGTNLTPEELSELRAEAQRAEALQTVTDTYLQAREKSDKVQAQEYDKSGYETAGHTLADARTALENEAERQAEDDAIVRPLAEKLSADLQEREKQIQTEIERQEQLAVEKAARAAAAAEAAEKARNIAAQENRLAELLEQIKTIYNANSLILRNVIRYSNLYDEQDVGLARVYQDLATKPDEYFRANRISSLSAKIAEAEAKAAKIYSFIDSLNANLESVSQ